MFSKDINGTVQHIPTHNITIPMFQRKHTIFKFCVLNHFKAITLWRIPKAP